MANISLLPETLISRYAAWKASTYQDKKALFRSLVDDGQHPPAMVISCADSRVQATALFGAEPGDLFMHRNVANIVPPCDHDSDNQSVAAAVEYAVTALNVKHLIVMGHSGCGGVAGCYAKCSGAAPELAAPTSHVGRWIEALRPAYDRLPVGSDEERVQALEKEGIILSLENLMTFPFVAAAVDEGRLALHGVWTDIAGGGLEQFDSDAGTFVAV